MARQPAIDIGISFIVTFQTYPHAPVFERQAMQILNLPVTFLTGDIFVNMALVIEQHMFGHKVHFHPGR